MWFLWLGLGLTLHTVGGLFLRRRLVDAAGVLGLAPRGQRVMRWVIAWLLFGYPVVAFATVGVMLALGRDEMGGVDGPLVAWLLVIPFFLTVLVTVQALPYLLVLELIRWIARKLGRAPGPPRRRALAVVAIVAAFAVYTPARILWQHGELRWREHVVEVGRGSAGTATTPRFRIAFVADVQQDAHSDVARLESTLRRLAAGADLVLSGGDWINMGPDHIEASARTAGLARGRLGTYSVRGDHEHFAYVDRARGVAEITAALRRHGVEMLHDEVRRFEHHGRTIAVGFITNSYPSPASVDMVERLVASMADADVRILVTHQLSDAIADRVRDRIDLVLAAHTHGGQVNPVLGLWHAPLARLETRYVDGRYQLGATTIIVTAGLGYSLVPFRYASPGSVETIDLVWRR